MRARRSKTKLSDNGWLVLHNPSDGTSIMHADNYRANFGWKFASMAELLRIEPFCRSPPRSFSVTVASVPNNQPSQVVRGCAYC